MKKLSYKLTLCVLTILIIFLASCSNTVNGNSNTETWANISNKRDLIGTWQADFYANGAHDTNTIYIGSNCAGYLRMEEDYSGTAQEYQNNIPAIISTLQNSGYTCTNNTANKKFTASINFTSADLDTLISVGEMQINSSKNKIRITSVGNTAEYVKQ